MSLLLNALKKAEDGKTPEGEKPAAAVDFDVAEGAESSASAPAAATATAGGGDAEPKSRVDAARVFGAKKESSRALPVWAKTALRALFGVGLVGGGIYGIIISGIIPGVDASFFGGLFGGYKPVTPVSTGLDPAEVFTAEAEKALPIPIVDVQSEVNFSSLRLPENSADQIGVAEFRRRLARTTGYDIVQERQRILEESGLLASAQEIEVEEELDVIEEEAPEAIPVRTAELSRDRKFEIDAATSSDGDFVLLVNGKDPTEEEEQEPAAVEVANAAGAQAPASQTGGSATGELVAQNKVDVSASAKGRERKAALDKAKRLYYSGAYQEAETLYRQILAGDATNRDALRGLAQVGVALGHYQLAAATYLELLNYYPNDPMAMAELINFRAGQDRDFYETEKVLKNLLGKNSKVDGRVYFALGNLYAENNRLYDAQKAYFEAHSRETDNPDYAYNLAVVFDHLSKPDLALRYYQKALELSDGVLVGFNRDETSRRVKELR
jgi:tetratricopeptide (TPR) repeat protein